ncbi:MULTISPECIES: protein-tyrosine phosphatase family protein [unclassified Microbacterium]|uniref:protein-tyrosine phosphatase family protein n=1 Tax=unclassified Microbacterium TaxID=2609290 RepID=UPI0010F5C97A|nr:MULTISPECIES: protein-tyrosine phosphatase family protein [unclassified Microbacterium]
MDVWTDEPGVVELPDGRRIRGTGARKRRRDVPAPDFAVYLLGRDPAPRPWPHRWVRWRDFRLPDSTEDAAAALREAWERASEQRVEITCGGGIGRTGTALALLTTMSGAAPEDAVAWVRTQYHRRAVETRKQRRWVEATAASLRAESE